MKKNATTLFSMSILMIVLLSSCSNSYDKIKNMTWEGEILRRSDHKWLSDVKLKMSNDTMYIFSNAIFGSENDTLKLLKFEEKDSTFTFNSLNGNRFTFKFYDIHTDTTTNVLFIGDDYSIVLGKSYSDIRSKGALNFYRNISVPRDAYMYLEGTYKGNAEMENQLSDFLMSGMGGFSIKLVFLDGFRVKMSVRNLVINMFASSSKPPYSIFDYTTDGNKLIFLNSDTKFHNIEVKDNGERIVMEADALNVELYKTN